MKTKLFLSAATLFLFSGVLLKAQGVNFALGSVKGFTGTCKVVIVDSTADEITEYSFEGPATLRNEIDMSPYNSSWPNPSITPGNISTSDVEEMVKSSKAMEDKWRVWKAAVKVKRKVKYNDGMSSADYVCTLARTDMLKLQIAISGDIVNIVPELTFSGRLNCTGKKDGVAVAPVDEHRLAPGNFKITQALPSGGSKRLTGTLKLTDGTQRMTVQWDFSPM